MTQCFVNRSHQLKFRWQFIAEENTIDKKKSMTTAIPQIVTVAIDSPNYEKQNISFCSSK